MTDLSSFLVTKKWPASHPDRIQLYSLPTPNGVKASIMLEETGLPYEPHLVSFNKKDQMTPEFLSVSPNNKIPAILDPNGPGGQPLALFESGAILIYLADKSGQFLPQDATGRYEAIQWLMFQMGGIGPMQGQANVFYRYAPEKIPFAIERYQNETKRLYRVLDKRLADREYLCGDYSIADIANWSWVSLYFWAGVEIDDLPHLQRWLKTVGERPAVQRGIEIPEKVEFNLDDEETAAQSGASLLVTSDK